MDNAVSYSWTLGLLGIVLGQTSGSYSFTVDDGDRQDMTVDVTFGSVVSVLHSFEIKLEKRNPDGSWSPVEGDGSSQLIHLLGGGTTSVSIPDIEAGDYRLNISNASAVSVLGSVSADITFVTEHLDQAAGTVPASGNIFDDNGNGADILPVGSTLSVFGADGNEIQVTGTTVINGQFGMLTINADGSFSYQPSLDADSIGNAETFTYKVVSQSGVVEDMATLTIDIRNADELGQARLTGAPERLEVDSHVPDDTGELGLLEDPENELGHLLTAFGKGSTADQVAARLQPEAGHDELIADYVNGTFAGGLKDDLPHPETPII